MEQFTAFLKYFISLGDKLFIIPDRLVMALNVADWVKDALIDTIHMLPFLFFVFLAIEIIEHKYSDKIKKLFGYSMILGPVIGAVAAVFPQCGFSVIAAGLYIKRIISRGTLIAVFIATSDEAIPILLSNTSMYKIILPTIGIKILVGIVAGYLVDLFSRRKLRMRFKKPEKSEENEEEKDVGCCEHHITDGKNKEIILHPIIHTVHIGFFILLITLILNYLFDCTDFEIMVTGVNGVSNLPVKNIYFAPIFTSIFGLIPNCSVSIGITLLYINGIINFPAMISGLCASAGLGLLVLLRRNRIKDTLLVVIILLSISIICGLILSLVS